MGSLMAHTMACKMAHGMACKTAHGIACEMAHRMAHRMACKMLLWTKPSMWPRTRLVIRMQTLRLRVMRMGGAIS